MGIITHPAFQIVGAMIGFLIGNYCAIGRDKRKEFSEAAADFRRVFNQALVDIQEDGGRYGHFISIHITKDQWVAYHNFRHHLSGESRNQYDEAWNDYHADDQVSSSQDRLEKDVARLLEFTEYRLRRHMVFVWRKYFPKKPEPLSEELTDMIEKYLGNDNKTASQESRIDKKPNTTA